MTIPDPTLPRYPKLKLPPFTIDVEPREFDDGEIAAEGAFYTFITIPDGSGVGDIFLQTGSVNGMGVPQAQLKLYDVSSDEWKDSSLTATSGEHLYLTVAGTGTIADGVLLPGFTVSSITPAYGVPPADDPPTKDDPSGTAYLSLGVFFGGAFYPAVAGNRNVAVCIGTFIKTAGA